MKCSIVDGLALLTIYFFNNFKDKVDVIQI